ncbi:MAG: PilT/PilU family type 4a pilus ATPase [Planctomycetes bacterium]|nr:PilT/PilU family type 4a pilus ATPase [Planctomycetota bacterium]
MSRHEASDLHMKAGTPCKFRLKGEIRNIDSTPISHEEIEAMAFEIMAETAIAAYRDRGAADFSYQIGGADRFRINVFRQRGKMSLAVRRVPREILNYEQLHLPASLSNLTKLEQGLILLAGITGSGKSTTIAAMLEEINRTRACHIVTLEDPIEFLYEDKKAFVNQREVGIDVENFDSALKYLMRQDPDVILIGELRDEETFGAAIAAAETGHLVFGTIHASSASGTIGRILELFPEEARQQIRTALVFSLQAIVCMKLLPGLQPDIPRVPCCEIMLCNSTIRKLIAAGRDSEIGAVIRNSYHENMVDFTESLRVLVEAEQIAVKTAYAAAPNPDELKMRLKGISVSSGGIIG